MNQFSSSVAASLAEFISRETGVDSVDETQDLIDSGILDSLLVMSVVAFVESRFGIRTEPSEITPSRFRSVCTLAAWVIERQTPTAESA